MHKCWPWVAMLVIGVSGALAGAQEPEFGSTAPPKVMDLDFSTPDEPAEAGDTVVTAEPTTDDPLLDGIGTEFDKLEAADRAPEATENSEAPPRNSGTTTPGMMVLRTFGALCAVLALVFLCAAGFKRWGKRTPLLAGQHLGKIIGRVGLSPQASLHYVQTNGEVLLLGVTQHSVTLLRTFDGDEFAAPVVEPKEVPVSDEKSDSSFLAQLTEVRAATGVEMAADADLDKLKGELQRLKQYFQDSARARE